MSQSTRSRGTIKPLSEWKNAKAAWVVECNGYYFLGGTWGFGPLDMAMRYTEQEAKEIAAKLRYDEGYPAWAKEGLE